MSKEDKQSEIKFNDIFKKLMHSICGLDIEDINIKHMKTGYGISAAKRIQDIMLGVHYFNSLDDGSNDVPSILLCTTKDDEVLNKYFSNNAKMLGYTFMPDLMFIFKPNEIEDKALSKLNQFIANYYGFGINESRMYRVRNGELKFLGDIKIMPRMVYELIRMN